MLPQQPQQTWEQYLWSYWPFGSTPTVTESNKPPVPQIASKPAENPGKTHTWEEVKKHTTSESCWIVISGKVFDVTRFLWEHPGGQDIILEKAGKDATFAFNDVQHSTDAQKLLQKYYIGHVETQAN